MAVSTEPSCRPASLCEAAAVSELVITAFVEGDSWYKRPSCQERLAGDRSGATVEKLMAEENTMFLVSDR